MSVYAASDLHGYPLKKFKALLKSAGFSAKDTLYIIGDVVDRNGDGGVAMLRYIMGQPNIEFLLGNHEDMLLACGFVFEEITEESIFDLSPERIAALERYLRNGGGVTINNLKELLLKEPEAFHELMRFLKEAPIVGSETVNGRDFVFVHGGFKDFSPEKKLSDYDPFDLLWERPKLTDEYFEDITTRLGHTPTLYYGEEHRGRIITTRTWINIDAGAAGGLPPALLRLDDMKVFYGK